MVSAVVVVPLLALFIAQLLDVVVLTPLLALIASTALAFLAILAFAGAILPSFVQLEGFYDEFSARRW
jgi:hypothetical protein